MNPHKHMLAGWRPGAQADQALQGSCRSCAAGADTDHALQGLIWIRRCRGSCRSSAAGAHADQALHGLMQIRRCRGSCRSSPERVHADQALHEHQHEAYVSDLSLRVGGIGRQAFELDATRARTTWVPYVFAERAPLLGP